MSDAVKGALEWLDTARTYLEEGMLGTPLSDPHRATIKRLLAEPRLPRALSGDDCSAFNSGYYGAPSGSSPYAIVRAGYSALYAHLTAPKTKTVWRITADDGCAGSSKDFDTEGEAMEALQLHLRDEEWVTIQRREVKS